MEPPDDQELRDMRHKQKCQQFQGKLATCMSCQKIFTVSDVVSCALKTHMGQRYDFPDWNRRLDTKAYEYGCDMDWMDSSPEKQAMRYFSLNALVNLHSVTHANRCFKKGSECYANLPEPRCDDVKICYNEEPDVWSNWMGHKQEMYMFRIYPNRKAEDSFMNTHNPTLTQVLGCNTNVMVAMNGCSVFYVTGYNAKSNQKEEKAAFEVISQVVVKHLEKQVCVIFPTCCIVSQFTSTHMNMDILSSRIVY